MSAGTLFILLLTSLSSYSQTPLTDSTKEDRSWIYKLGSQQFLGDGLPTFKAVDMNGKKIKSEYLAEKVVFVNVWFEACPPCIAEFGALNELYEKYKSRKDFLFISFTFESKKTVERLTREYNLNYPVLLVSQNQAQKLNFGQGYPLNMIINKKGKIIFISPGGPVDPKEAMEKFDIAIKPELDLLLQKENE